MFLGADGNKQQRLPVKRGNHARSLGASVANSSRSADPCSPKAGTVPKSASSAPWRTPRPIIVPPEQEAAQKRAEEIRVEQQAQKDLNKAEREQTAKIREAREAERDAAKKKRDEEKKAPKKTFWFW